MTQDSFPITPPQWQVDAWCKQALAMGADIDAVFLEAVRWGADQRLEAVKHWLITGPYGASIAAGSPTFVTDLCDAFKPKPPSLKEQALEVVDRIEKARFPWATSELDTIRRALETLPS